MSHAPRGICNPAKIAASILLVLALMAVHAATPSRHACQRATIEGQVSAGQEWTSPIGEGWVFRILPVAASPAAYSGWDLVVDRDPPAGYPDALLLATPPYGSINQREIATTFGLRAQDAIGWNPRSFHFLLDPRRFHDAQQLFRQSMLPRPSSGATRDAVQQPGARPIARLLEFQKGASSGELRILDARLVPGTADPQPYAQAWALAGMRTPHQVMPVSPGESTARGNLVSIRFTLTLWLPSDWRFPPVLRSQRTPCPE